MGELQRIRNMLFHALYKYRAKTVLTSAYTQKDDRLIRILKKVQCNYCENQSEVIVQISYLPKKNPVTIVLI